MKNNLTSENLLNMISQEVCYESNQKNGTAIVEITGLRDTKNPQLFWRFNKVDDGTIKAYELKLSFNCSLVNQFKDMVTQPMKIVTLEQVKASSQNEQIIYDERLSLKTYGYVFYENNANVLLFVPITIGDKLLIDETK